MRSTFIAERVGEFKTWDQPKQCPGLQIMSNMLPFVHRCFPQVLAGSGGQTKFFPSIPDAFQEHGQRF